MAQSSFNWTTQIPEYGIVCATRGNQHLILLSWQILYCVEVKSGKVLWSQTFPDVAGDMGAATDFRLANSSSAVLFGYRKGGTHTYELRRLSLKDGSVTASYSSAAFIDKTIISGADGFIFAAIGESGKAEVLALPNASSKVSQGLPKSRAKPDSFLCFGRSLFYINLEGQPQHVGFSSAPLGQPDEIFLGPPLKRDGSVGSGSRFLAVRHEFRSNPETGEQPRRLPDAIPYTNALSGFYIEGLHPIRLWTFQSHGDAFAHRSLGTTWDVSTVRGVLFARTPYGIAEFTYDGQVRRWIDGDYIIDVPSGTRVAIVTQKPSPSLSIVQLKGGAKKTYALPLNQPVSVFVLGTGVLVVQSASSKMRSYVSFIELR